MNLDTATEKVRISTTLINCLSLHSLIHPFHPVHSSSPSTEPTEPRRVIGLQRTQAEAAGLGDHIGPLNHRHRPGPAARGGSVCGAHHGFVGVDVQFRRKSHDVT